MFKVQLFLFLPIIPLDLGSEYLALKMSIL